MRIGLMCLKCSSFLVRSQHNINKNICPTACHPHPPGAGEGNGVAPQRHQIGAGHVSVAGWTRAQVLGQRGR